MSLRLFVFFFFFNDPAPPEIYPLPLHDALPISLPVVGPAGRATHRLDRRWAPRPPPIETMRRDRKSTRLNSSHSQISYAVFCLKKKKNNITTNTFNISTCRHT